MTNDEITKFAAEKLGKTIKQGPVVVGFEEERMEWFEVDAYGDVVDNFEPLTSGDLLLEGMAAFRRQFPDVIFRIDFIEPTELHEFAIYCPKTDIEVIEKISTPLEAPLAFWTCWAKVEAMKKGES